MHPNEKNETSAKDKDFSYLFPEFLNIWEAQKLRLFIGDRITLPLP